MKKTVRKGFTLVELLVVMAIFSILLVGVMAITKPVSTLFRNTSLSEKTYAYANNIQVYLQGKLEYAEDIVVATSDHMDVNSDLTFNDVDLATMAEDFRSTHFNNTVGYNGTAVVPLKGKIHIVRLVNSTTDPNFPQGSITERVYDFTSDTAIPTSTVVTETQDLNPAYFTAQDAAYNFSYALGASTLEVVPTPPGGDSKQVYRALDKDIEDSLVNIGSGTLSVTIVLDKRNGGALTVPAGSGKGPNSYRAYRDPVAIQVAPLPLTNIYQRGGRSATGNLGITRPYKDPATGTVQYQTLAQSSVGLAYEDTRANKSVDFSNDIYFVFAYSDEIINK